VGDGARGMRYLMCSSRVEKEMSEGVDGSEVVEGVQWVENIFIIVDVLGEKA
jgi:hypothetical protein